MERSDLAREADEFVRMLVTRALLWGIGVTMVANILLAAFFEGPHALNISEIYSIDVFCITAMAAMFIQLRRNQ